MWLMHMISNVMHKIMFNTLLNMSSIFYRGNNFCWSKISEHLIQMEDIHFE